MSREATINLQLQYSDSDGTSDSLQLANGSYSVTTKVIAHIKATAPTTAAAMNLGSVAALGLVLIINRDPTNFVTLLTGNGGAVFNKILPGLGTLFYFGSGVTAPFIKADTAPCLVDYLLLSV
jgi:hypothetical protein